MLFEVRFDSTLTGKNQSTIFFFSKPRKINFAATKEEQTPNF